MLIFCQEKTKHYEVQRVCNFSNIHSWSINHLWLRKQCFLVFSMICVSFGTRLTLGKFSDLKNKGVGNFM